MDALIQVLNPEAPLKGGDSARDGRALGSLEGATVGFIDNAKPNFAFLADDLEAMLKHRFGVARVIRHQKPNASVGAREEVIADLARECDLVVTGSGD
jgi:hypothetical protein